MQLKKTVTVITGDGIGPEVSGAAIKIMEAAKVPLTWEYCIAGEKAFRAGISTGVPQETLDSVERNGIVLKGPLETPVGFGGKSANVTLRKMFEMYGNIRPVRELPNVHTPFSGRNIDMVIVRENVEDLYAGIEYMVTPNVAKGLKLMSRKGCEKILRLAFEIARAEHRGSVHCATKANILKLSEGMMKRLFEEIASDYPEIDAKHIIIDNCAHQLMINPEQFEVIVTSNMNGDIISDQAAGLVGGLGIAASANLGNDVCMFESVHGSAPEIAGQNKANPLAFLGSSVMMLRHLGLFEHAETIENAVLLTLAQDRKTADLRPKIPPLSTDEFTDVIIDNLGKPYSLEKSVRAYCQLHMPVVKSEIATPPERRVIGIDISIEATGEPQIIGDYIKTLAKKTAFKLQLISSRGTQVYPVVPGKTDIVNYWRCRFLLQNEEADVQDAQIIELLQVLSESKVRWCHFERLQDFEGSSAYSSVQGEGTEISQQVVK